MTCQLSIIIPVWNGYNDLPSCLASVTQQANTAADITTEIIIVDDASTDQSVAFINQTYPQITVLQNPTNLGFVKSCNIGLSHAQGQILILLNQDTEVQSGWLSALVKTLQNDATIGIVGSKALFPDGTLQHAGGYLDHQGSGMHVGYGEVDKGQYDEQRPVEFVTGASLAITRQLYERIGGLDEGFAPAYFEDVDWCYRAHKAGFQVIYVPQSLLIHKEVSLLRNEQYDGIYLFHRNRLRFVLKHWPLQKLTDEFLTIESEWLHSLEAGGELLVAAMHRAYLHQLLHLSDLLIWRQRLWDASDDEADLISAILLQLRTVYPLKLLGLTDGLSEQPPVVIEFIESLSHLRQEALVREQPFQSHVPIVGQFVAGFRERWNRVATKWYMGPILEQQNQFNQSIISKLAETIRLHNWQTEKSVEREHRLAEVLSEYVRENSREIAELSAEVRALKARLSQAENGE